LQAVQDFPALLCTYVHKPWSTLVGLCIFAPSCGRFVSQIWREVCDAGVPVSAHNDGVSCWETANNVFYHASGDRFIYSSALLVKNGGQVDVAHPYFFSAQCLHTYSLNIFITRILYNFDPFAD
jgi:hypothetical protein